jgi:hypothetical protein
MAKLLMAKIFMVKLKMAKLNHGLNISYNFLNFICQIYYIKNLTNKISF